MVLLGDTSSLAQCNFVDQIQLKNGNSHFGTTDIIYGLGYDPKSHRNEFGHSIDCYTKS